MLSPIILPSVGHLLWVLLPAAPHAEVSYSLSCSTRYSNDLDSHGVFERLPSLSLVWFSALAALGLSLNHQCSVVCLLAANLMMRTRLPPKSQRPPTPPPDVKGIVTDTAFQLAVLGYVLMCQVDVPVLTYALQFLFGNAWAFLAILLPPGTHSVSMTRAVLTMDL